MCYKIHIEVLADRISCVDLLAMNGIKSKRCSVPGCQNKSSQRHRFPIREPGIFQQWLKALNYAPFLKMTPHQIYNSHYVCHQHFAEDVTVPGTKRGLKVSAVPTLFLPENVSVNNNNDVKVEEKPMVLQNIEMREWDKEFKENVNSTCDDGESSLMEKYYQIEKIEIKSEILDDILRLIDLEHDYSNKNISPGNARITSSLDSTVDTVEQQNDETNYDISQTIVETLEEFLVVDFEERIEGESNTIKKTGNERETNRKRVISKKETKINKGNKYFCSTCMESFTVKEDYEYHLEIHPPYVCEFCGKAFKRKDSLRAHRFTHNSPNSFICEVCGKGCKEYSALRCHLKTHRSDKSYICDKCSKTFKTRHHLLVHIKYVHNKDYTDQCSQCGLRFRGRAAVRNHIRLVHLKVKPYECDVCQRKFGRPDYLRQHKAMNCCERELGLRGDSVRQHRTKIIVNNNDELLPCKFCGKVIQGKIRLRRHLYLHVNRYKCHFCSQSFVAKYNRNKHELIHQNVPDFFTCNVCYRIFKSIKELEKHAATQIHRRQRKYFCCICYKRFHRRFLLSRHNLTEHVSAVEGKVLDRIVYENVLEDD